MNWLRLFFSLPNSTIARSGRRDRPCVLLLYIYIYTELHLPFRWIHQLCNVDLLSSCGVEGLGAEVLKTKKRLGDS